MTAPVLRLSDARFGYRGVVAAQADLQVAAGEVVALLGSNGSGKSTLVKGSLGLIECYGGSVEWFGKPRDRSDPNLIVGYVPQRQPATSPVPSTLEELVRTGRLAHRGLLGRYRADDRRAVADAIEAVGLGGQNRTPVRELSGGQQRRALVARALASQANALVLDEPFAGVDHDSQDALAAVLHDLAASGVTLLIVLHEIGPLHGVITRGIQLAAGQVIFDGEPSLRPESMIDLAGHDPHCEPEVFEQRTFGGLFAR